MPFNQPMNGCAGRDYHGAPEHALSAHLYSVALQGDPSRSFVAFSSLQATKFCDRKMQLRQEF